MEDVDYLKDIKTVSSSNINLNDDNQIYSLVDEYGNEIISFMAKEKFQSITISSNKIIDGKYFLFSGGTQTGLLNNYIYEELIRKVN